MPFLNEIQNVPYLFLFVNLNLESFPRIIRKFGGLPANIRLFTMMKDILKAVLG